jgi:hypothetical protein
MSRQPSPTPVVCPTCCSCCQAFVGCTLLALSVVSTVLMIVASFLLVAAWVGLVMFAVTGGRRCWVPARLGGCHDWRTASHDGRAPLAGSAEARDEYPHLLLLLL